MDQWIKEIVNACRQQNVEARDSVLRNIISRIESNASPVEDGPSEWMAVEASARKEKGVKGAIQLSLGDLASVKATRRLVFEYLAERAEDRGKAFVVKQYKARFGQTVVLPLLAPFGVETRFIPKLLDELARKATRSKNEPTLTIEHSDFLGRSSQAKIVSSDLGLRILKATNDVVKATGWSTSVATTFVLSGEAVGVSCAQVKFQRRDLAACSEIHLRLNPELSKKEVADIYASIRREIADARQQSHSDEQKSTSPRARSQSDESLEEVISENFQQGSGWGLSQLPGARDLLIDSGVAREIDWRTRERIYALAYRPYKELPRDDQDYAEFRRKLSEVTKSLMDERLRELNSNFDSLMQLDLGYFLSLQIWDHLLTSEPFVPESLESLELGIEADDPTVWIDMQRRTLPYKALASVSCDEAAKYAYTINWKEEATEYLTGIHDRLVSLDLKTMEANPIIAFMGDDYSHELIDLKPFDPDVIFSAFSK